MTSFSLKRMYTQNSKRTQERRNTALGDYITQLCPEDFKQPVKQQVCDMVSDPDFRDESRIRPDFNRSFFCDPVYMPSMALKIIVTRKRIVCSFQWCLNL